VLEPGTKPVIQYVAAPFQTGKILLFSELAEGADKVFTQLMDETVSELFNTPGGWHAADTADLGAWGKAVSAKFREKVEARWGWPLSDRSQWQTGVRVEFTENGNIYRGQGFTNGAQGIVEIDAVYFEKGYKPKPDDVLDPTKIIVYEAKTSANGMIPNDQLQKLIKVQGGPIRQSWSPLMWDRPNNSLVQNPLYKRALTFARNLPFNEAVVIGASAGIFLTLSSAPQALANFEQEALTLRDYIISNKWEGDIKLQEAKLVSMFGDLVNGFTGGTLGEFVDATLLYQVYKRLLPALSRPPQ